MDIGLLVLRLAVGLTMAAHGGQKLFGWFGGYGIAGTGGFLESLGFRPGKVHAGLAGTAELVGGLLIALGLLTPVGAALVIAVMVVAIGSVHLPKGFFVSDGGFEYNLMIVASSARARPSPVRRLLPDVVEGLELAVGCRAWITLVAGLVLGGGALRVGARSRRRARADRFVSVVESFAGWP
jgi:putative oxidoreductase